jgi:branched-chain amino acid transport system permease protein
LSVAASPTGDTATAATGEDPATRVLIRRHRLRWWEALPWIAGLVFFFAFPDYLGFGCDLLVMVLFALSLDLALGYAGIITLGHGAFFGVGAYTVGMLASYNIWTEPITSLFLAAAVAAGIGFLSGLVLLRTTGLTLLMLTLCTMLLLYQAANMAAAYTGGFDGLPSLPIGPVFGVFDFNPLYADTQYLFALAVLFVCFLFVRTLVYSPFGQGLTGIRENVLRMHAIGSPVRRRLIVCYTISAGLAGIAGALSAQTTAFVNLAVLGLDRSATVFIVLILGGYGRLYGAFIGAIVYLPLEHFLAQIYPAAWQLGLGILLLLIALFARNGILGFSHSLWRRYGARRKSS